jgi:hypothetical protein
MTHWAKFDRCLADVTEQRARSRPGFERCLDRFIFEMRTAQRFYLPDAATVLIDGRRYDDFKDLLRLPYPAVALLSETVDTETGRAAWKITLAIDSTTDGKAAWLLFSANTIPGKRTGPEWLMVPLVPMVVHVPPTGGLPHGLPDMPETHLLLQNPARTQEQWLKEFQDDLAAIATLCIMLNSVNVRSATVDAPARLNAKRATSGKPPLYSYHVLDVDGERWDRPERGVSPAEESGVRSHLRRGHIRRLPKGPTWVRAAYVHGSRDGFVDKDYNVVRSTC